MTEEKKVKKGILDYLYSIIKVICKLFLVAEIAITSMAVAGRYIPFIPDPAWTRGDDADLYDLYGIYRSSSGRFERNSHSNDIS